MSDKNVNSKIATISDHLLARITFEEDGKTIFGASQEWFETLFRKQAGCASTSAAMLFSLMEENSFRPTKKTDWLPLMNEWWGFLQPGIFGLNSTAKFVFGANQFFKKRFLPAKISSLNLPYGNFPPWEEIETFLFSALKEDRAVAFLNLSNGKEKNLQSCHWVVIVGLEKTLHSVTATILDEGRLKKINLSLWFSTTKHSAGFVCFS